MRPQRWSDLPRRATTAAVAIPVVLAIAMGPWPLAWSGLVLVGSLIAAWECMTLLLGPRQPAITALGVFLALAAWVATYLPPLEARFKIGLALLLVGGATIAGAAVRLLPRKAPRTVLAIAAAMLLTAAWCGVLPAHLALLRRDAGSAWLLLALGVSWGGDVAGYFYGKTWGGARLAPAISPGKTVAGAIAGLLVAGLAGLVFSRAGPPGLDPFRLVVVTLVAGVLSQAGDLAESLLKRRSGAKDSGRLIPGHGGMLDCIDGLCLAAPWLYYASPHVTR